MARFRVTSPDGKAFVVNAPDGATPDQVKAYAQQQFAARVPAGPAQKAESEYDPREGMGGVESALVRLGRGAQDSYQGISQLALEAATARPRASVQDLVRGDEPGFVERGAATVMDSLPLVGNMRRAAHMAGIGRDDLDAYTRAKTDELALYERNNPNREGIDWWRLTGNAASLPIPGVGQGTMATRLGGAALTGAVQGGAQFVPEGESRAENAAWGAATGAGAQGIIGEPLRALMGRLTAFARGGKANVTPAAADALNFAADNDLPLYYDDVTKSGVAKITGTLTDEIPVFGSGKSREVQQQAALKAAEKAVAKFDTGNTGRTADTLRESAEAQLGRAKGIKNKLYTDAFAALNQAGEIEAPRMRAEAMRLAQAEAKRGTLADQGLIQQLKDFAEAPKFKFEDWHQARAQLGDIIRSGKSGENAVLGSRATAGLTRVKQALDQDLNYAASELGGDGARLWRRADTFYRETMPKYKRGVVADLLRSNNPDAIAERMLGGSDRDGISRAVYGALDRNGRAEVRSALMQKALANAIEGDKPFSPAKFAQQLDKAGKRIGVFFKPEDRKMLDGLANYMEHVKRAGQYMENPPTGKRLGQVIAGGAVVMNPAMGMKALAGAAGVTQLFRTRTGRDLLLRFGSVSPQSKAAQRYAQELNGLLTRTAAAQATSPTAGGR